PRSAASARSSGRLARRDLAPALAASRGRVADGTELGRPVVRALASRWRAAAGARAHRAGTRGARRKRLAGDHAVPADRLPPARDAAAAARFDFPRAERP